MSQRKKFWLEGNSGEPRPNTGNKPQPENATGGNTIAINIALPKIKKPAIDYKKHRKYGIYAAAAIVVLLISWTGIQQFSNKPKGAANLAGDAKPAFKPLVPKADTKNQQQLNENYDSNRQLLAYKDAIAGADLVVSQQPLPDDFKHNDGALKSAADSIGAKEKEDTNKGDLYISTNKRTNQQVAMFKTNDLLVFVRTSKVLDPYYWVKYINELKLGQSAN